MRRAICAAICAALIFVSQARARRAGGTFPRYCLTLAVPLRPQLRERVSAVNLSIENASVIGIPRFPVGWGLKVQNWVSISPSRISGGATGSVAELGSEDLKCFVEVEDSVPGAPPIKVTGSVYVSTGNHERRVFLRRDEIVLQPITSPAAPSAPR